MTDIRKKVYLLCLTMAFLCTGCGSASAGVPASSKVPESAPEIQISDETETQDGNNQKEQSISLQGKTNESEEQKVNDRKIHIQIGGAELTAVLEDNETAEAFMAMMPLTVKMSGYGGFEQVGSLGKRLPRNDRQTTTSAGDIVLYNGNSVVIFYGSNSWSYTRLGKINDKTAAELEEILGTGDIEVTFSTVE